MYVDGFVMAVRRDRLAAYRTLARKAGKLWREHGALQYVECVADDVPDGKVTSFPMAVKLRRGEVAVFSWIVFRSRAHRDRVNKKVMADPRLDAMTPDKRRMPFDMQRMIYGGFRSLVSL
jgi:uncharacterized protein YbaA (DUF1428 family)